MGEDALMWNVRVRRRKENREELRKIMKMMRMMSKWSAQLSEGTKDGILSGYSKALRMITYEVRGIQKGIKSVKKTQYVSTEEHCQMVFVGRNY